MQFTPAGGLVRLAPASYIYAPTAAEGRWFQFSCGALSGALEYSFPAGRATYAGILPDPKLQHW
jgi:hypothetical protein